MLEGPKHAYPLLLGVRSRVLWIQDVKTTMAHATPVGSSVHLNAPCAQPCVFYMKDRNLPGTRESGNHQSPGRSLVGSDPCRMSSPSQHYALCPFVGLHGVLKDSRNCSATKP
jgi:hypothetical protein